MLMFSDFCKGYEMSCSGTVSSSCNVNVLPCPGLQTMFVFSNTVDTKGDHVTLNVQDLLRTNLTISL